MYAVTEGSGCQSRELALVAVGKRNHDSIGCEIVKSSKRVGSEAGLGLFAIGQDRRTGLFETIYGVPKRLRVCAVERLTGDFASLEGCNRLNQLRWAGDAANRFGRNRHPGSVPRRG